jgi:hypothetical protein
MSCHSPMDDPEMFEAISDIARRASTPEQRRELRELVRQAGQTPAGIIFMADAYLSKAEADVIRESLQDDDAPEFGSKTP